MNLVEIIAQDELRQDDWSKTPRTFGANNQIQIIGWVKSLSGRKLYVIKCHKCSQDYELFGEGYFRQIKSELVKGGLPCGCSHIPKWSKEQHMIRCDRAASALGYKFLGFFGEWNLQYTKLRMKCKIHGEWDTGTITSLINSDKGCPHCAMESLWKLKTRTNKEMTELFLATGAFHPDTKFWRSDKLTSQGVSAYWFMSCPECGEEGESFVGNLHKGHRPCHCSTARQQEAYVNFIEDGGLLVGIKFGIANNSVVRASSQNRVCAFEVVNKFVYTFPETKACKAAEKECKQSLECGVILKRDMPDGYTETTYVYNLDKIIQIYKKHGGVEVWK